VCYAAESTSIEEFFVCLFVFVSLLCKMTTPDIDHPFLYQLLVTQSLEQPNFNF